MLENFIKLTTIWYVIITLGISLILLFFGLYILSIYHFGKPLKLFFFGRLKTWINNKIVIFQVFTLDHEIFLEYGTKEKGGGYRPGEEYKGLTWYERKIQKKTPPIKSDILTIPKSTYSINGVTTLPVLELYPELHKEIKEGLEELLKNKIETLSDLTKKATRDPDEILINKQTYKSFLELYSSAKQKYTVKVTAGDVLNFIGNNFDKNFRETIDAKNFNSKAKSKTENTYLKYGYMAVLAVAVGLTVKIIYVVIY